MSYAVEKSGKFTSPIFGSRFAATCLLLVLLLAARAAAQGEPAANVGDRPKHADRVKSDYENNLAKFKEMPDVLVLPGLIANRKEQRVRIMAEATGLTEGTTLDFLLIGPGSGRGYEALAWSHARPSDVHKALEFIGMRPGQPFNPAKLRFWSKGERVRLTVGPMEADELIPFESMVTLRALVDRASLELFAGGDQAAASFVVVPETHNRRIRIDGNEELEISSLVVNELRSIWERRQ